MIPRLLGCIAFLSSGLVFGTHTHNINYNIAGTNNGAQNIYSNSQKDDEILKKLEAIRMKLSTGSTDEAEKSLGELQENLRKDRDITKSTLVNAARSISKIQAENNKIVQENEVLKSANNIIQEEKQLLSIQKALLKEEEERINQQKIEVNTSDQKIIAENSTLRSENQGLEKVIKDSKNKIDHLTVVAGLSSFVLSMIGLDYLFKYVITPSLEKFFIQKRFSKKQIESNLRNGRIIWGAFCALMVGGAEFSWFSHYSKQIKVLKEI